MWYCGRLDLSRTYRKIERGSDRVAAAGAIGYGDKSPALVLDSDIGFLVPQ